MAYTEAEKAELYDAWLDRVAETDPAFAEEIVMGIIQRQKEMGLIGPQRRIRGKVSPVPTLAQSDSKKIDCSPGEEF